MSTRGHLRVFIRPRRGFNEDREVDRHRKHTNSTATTLGSQISGLKVRSPALQSKYTITALSSVAQTFFFLIRAENFYSPLAE